MKRLFACTLALALICGGAGAQEARFWTRREDLYHHFNARCGGMENAVPINEEAALAFEKYACPVCIQQADEAQNMRAVARGGTIVVCFSDAYLSQLTLSEVLGERAESFCEGDDAWCMLAEYLHGEAYNAFLEEMSLGKAEARARIPKLCAGKDDLIMNRRHIGGNWYVIVRPQEKFEDKWVLDWQVSEYELRMEGDRLYAGLNAQSVDAHDELTLERMDSSGLVAVQTINEMEIEIYRALEGNVTVIREEKDSKAQIESARLCIDGNGVELSGYADGAAAVYCCMLTDGEQNRLWRSENVELRHVEWTNGRLYRTSAQNEFRYYSTADESLVFTVPQSGEDCVKDAFYVQLGGEPDCFVLRRAGADELWDYDGRQREIEASDAPDFLTPLAWRGEKGVLLAEKHGGAHALGEEAIKGEMKLNEIYDLGTEEMRQYVCWLVDESGNNLLQPDTYQSISVQEDGRIILWDAQSTGVICGYLLDET